MPPLRKYPSGHEKRKKKKESEKAIESQKGALDKFFIVKEQKSSPFEDSNEEERNESNDGVDVEEVHESGDVLCLEDNVDSISNASPYNIDHDFVDCDEDYIIHPESGDDGDDDISVSHEEISSSIPLDIYDPRNWDNLDGKWRDLLVEKGPTRDVLTGKGPKDESKRRFSSEFYTLILPNGQKHHRDWLVYSKALNKAFCFCCKLFKKRHQSTNQLVNEGYCDWRHFSSKLKEHEISIEHATNFASWLELRIRLEKNKTIDHAIQVQIKKEKEHWRNVLHRLISVVKFLALLHLAEETDTDSKIRSEAKSLATYELGNFEFLVGIVIWYDILGKVNIVSKSLQSEDMLIDIAMTKIKGLIASFEEYRENGFEQAMDSAKKLASSMDIEPIFPEKRQIRRKRHFDELSSEHSQIPQESVEEKFRIHYFLFIIDQTIGSLKKRFEQYEEYENLFGFLFTADKLNSLDDEDLRARCKNLERKLQGNERMGQHFSDLDGDDLYQELKIIQHMLPQDTKTASKILNFLQQMNCFPNSFIAYRILLTIPVTVASAERSFSKLKLLKSCLRSTMTQTRLNALSLISIESEFLEKLNYEELIDDFADKTTRRSIFHS